MEEKILKRVLHIGSQLTAAGGIESFIYGIEKNSNSTSYKFDFLIENFDVYDKKYEEYILSKGGKVYKLPISNRFQNIFGKFKLFRKYKNEIIHIHTNCGTRAIDGLIAKMCGARAIIYHAHTNMGNVPVKFKLLRPIFYYTSKKLLACSEEAGNFFFGKYVHTEKFKVVNNGVDTNIFRFDRNRRSVLRSKYCWKDKLVIAFVGRFSPEKNILYFLEICKELRQVKSEIKVVLVGEGEEKNRIDSYIKEHNMSEYVDVLGVRKDVSDLLNAFDCLVLPSFYEGLGIILVEAQSMGMRCIASDRIPSCTNLTDLIQYRSIEEKPVEWAVEIAKIRNDYNRDEYYLEIENKGYDIRTSRDNLFNIYEELT